MVDEELLRYKERLEAKAADKPFWEKKCLTINEAAEYSSIGRAVLRRMTSEKNCPFVVSSSNQVLIVREKFENYIKKHKRIGRR